MKVLIFLLAVAGSCTTVGPLAAHEVDSSSRVGQQLVGVSTDEAEALISKVKEAQENLRRKRFQPFLLLAGSVASYDEAKIAPIDVFLDVPFDDVWEVKKVSSARKDWKSFVLSYTPQGLGKAYWEIEVLLGYTGEIHQITLLYKPPAPF